MATAAQSRQMNDTMARLRAGVTGGLAGGMVFGMMMAMMGMLPMVAALIGASSVGVGWLVHLAISAVIGAGFAVIAGWFLTGYARAAVAGAVYGMVWWVLGPLLLMPARLGMPLFALNATTTQSLMGHVIYGVVLALVAVLLLGRGRRGAAGAL